MVKMVRGPRPSPSSEDMDRGPRPDFGDYDHDQDSISSQSDSNDGTLRAVPSQKNSKKGRFFKYCKFYPYIITPLIFSSFLVDSGEDFDIKFRIFFCKPLSTC